MRYAAEQRALIDMPHHSNCPSPTNQAATSSSTVAPDGSSSRAAPSGAPSCHFALNLQPSPVCSTAAAAAKSCAHTPLRLRPPPLNSSSKRSVPSPHRCPLTKFPSCSTPHALSTPAPCGRPCQRPPSLGRVGLQRALVPCAARQLEYATTARQAACKIAAHDVAIGPPQRALAMRPR
eukprot:scaffold24153_cov50-Phaeocystis_antarctica.AAC.2